MSLRHPVTVQNINMETESTENAVVISVTLTFLYIPQNIGVI